VNNLGQTLVEALNAEGSLRTYHVVDLDGTSVQITPLTSDYVLIPQQINDLGQVRTNFRDGLIWDPVQGYIDTGLDIVHDLNNLGQAVGFIFTGEGNSPLLNRDAYLYDAGTLIKLADVTVGLDEALDSVSATRLLSAYYLNDHGQILAYTDTRGGPAFCRCRSYPSPTRLRYWAFLV